MAHHNMDSIEAREKIIEGLNKGDATWESVWIGMEIKDGAWQYIDGSTRDFVWGSWEAENGATTPDFSFDGNNGKMNVNKGNADNLKSSYWNAAAVAYYSGLCEIQCPSAEPETAETECESSCAYKHPKFSSVDINLNSLAGKTYEFLHQGKTVTFSPCGGMKVGSEQCAAITYGDEVRGIQAPEWEVAEGATMNFDHNGKSTTIYVMCKAAALEPESSHSWGSDTDNLNLNFRTVCACKGKCDDNGVIE
jgi:hypothetical protein